MAVFRVNKNKNYTVMSNYHFKDKNISLKAKGLLSQMLSLPDDWDYTVAGLCSINKESEGAITSALRELEENRYLRRTKIQNEKGRFDYIYDIFEKPNSGKPDPENPPMDNPVLENRVQLNTNKQNTKQLNTNTISKDIEQAPENYGNKDINLLFDEWEKHCAFRVNSKIKLNRYACNRLIKSKGVEAIIKVIPIVAESQSDTYAPTIANFIDLEQKWNNLAIWYQKRLMTKKKNSMVVV